MVGFHGFGLGGGDAAQLVPLDKRAGNFRQGIENRLFIIVSGRQEFSLGRLFGSRQLARLEEGAGQIGSQPPAAAAPLHVAQICGGQAARRRQGDGREVVGNGHSYLRIGGAQLVFALADVRPSGKDVGRNAGGNLDVIGDVPGAAGTADMAGSASGQDGDCIFQIGDLHLNGGNLGLGGSQGRLGGSHLKPVAYLAFKLFVKQAQAFGIGFHGFLHNGKLFVQLEELEVGVRHLAEQGKHERALAFFGSQIVRAGSFRHPARFAPDIQFPGNAGGKRSRRQCGSGSLDDAAAGIVGAFADGAGIIRPREERGLRDGDVLACLFHARHGSFQIAVVIVGVRQEVLVFENFPPGKVRNGFRRRGGSPECRGHGHVHRFEVGAHHAGGGGKSRSQQDGACDVWVCSHMRLVCF